MTEKEQLECQDLMYDRICFYEQEMKDEMYKLANKYCDLVWYARSGCFLDKHSPEVKDEVLNMRAKVEEMYPKDIEQYNRHGDFSHGFNSGCLAAFRLISKVLDVDGCILCSDYEEGERHYPTSNERLRFALGLFPNCDT